MPCHMAYHLAYQIIPYMDSNTEWYLSLSNFQILHKSNKRFLMWCKYYSWTIGSLFFISSQHFEAVLFLSVGLIWALPGLWCCHCSTDPHCLALSICHFKTRWQKPNRDKSLNTIWCPAPTKGEKWDSVSCSSVCHNKEENQIDRFWCKWSEN